MNKWVVHCRKDKYDVYCGRPSIFGNPFSWLSGTSTEFLVKDRVEAVEKYREWIKTQTQILQEIPKLKGKILGCWCYPKTPCHCEILAEIANFEDNFGF